MALDLDPALLDAAKAIGLLKGNGDFDSSWFEHVFERATSILSNPVQRNALLAMLDRLAPPQNPPGLAAGEKWHPLLGDQPQGNAYLTVRNSAGGAVIGLAGEVQGGPAGGPQGALRIHLPLLGFGNNSPPQLVAGTASAPFALDLRVQLGLSRAAGDAITLAAARVSLRWAVATAAAPAILIVLEGLGLDDGGTRDLTLDPTELGSAAVEVIAALIKQLLPASGPAAALRHLLGVLGLDEDPVPPLPLAQLAQGPAALQSWLNAIISGGHLGSWLGHFAGLVGLPTATSGIGTLADPRRVRLLALGTHGEFNLAVAQDSGRLHLSLGIRLAPDGVTQAARLDASATLIAIPLAGNGSALILPRAEVLVTSPGAAGTLVSQAGTIIVERLNAGLRWNGSALLPTLELLGVTFGATPRRERVDLTHADSVADAAAAGLEAALTALLGGAGSPLLALVGLADPQAAPAGWPHRLNAARLQDLAVDPTRTLGSLHRAMLVDPTHHWGFMLDELRRLVGLPGAVTGIGTSAAPWFVPLASTPALAIGFSAYNDTPGDSTARLRIGFRAQMASAPWQLDWQADLLGFDITVAGGADIRLFGGQRVRLAVGPFPGLAAQTAISADGVTAQLQWQPGSGLKGTAQLENLRLRVDGGDLVLGTLSLPQALPFDLGDPASLPLPAAQLQRVASVLLARALKETLGGAGEWAGALLGLHGELPGLPVDWPTLFDPADPLRLASNPEAALRSWLDRLVAGASTASGNTMPHLIRLLGWLQRGLQAGSGTPFDLPAFAEDLPRLRGSGVWVDPWCIPLQGAGRDARAELLLWLDPDGAAAAWGPALAGAIAASGNALAMLRLASPLMASIPALREALQGSSIDAVAAGIGELARSLEDSDGFVPIASQRVMHADWNLGNVVPNVAHHLQPAHAGLIAQALDQLDVWAPVPANRVVLLVHPAFAVRDCWNAWIAAAIARDAGAATPPADQRHFDLRVPGANALTLDLGVTVGVSRTYTADLADDGSGNHVNLSQQISRVVARITQLRPGAKLIIVAHSTAGIAARQFCADHPALVGGLVTIGTPHRGAPLDALRQPSLAQALRVAGRWLASMPASPARDALQRLHAALDGWRDGGANLPPVADVFPVGSFAPTASVATNGVPALALGSRLGGDAFLALRSGLSAFAGNAPAGALPTHLGVGVRAALGERVDSLARVRLHVRADLTRIALRTGVPVPTRPAQSLAATLTLEDPSGGYLVGTPQSHAAIGAAVNDVRVRALRLGLTVTRSAAGLLAAAVEAEALDAAFHGPTLPRMTLAHPLAPQVIGAAFDQVFNAPDSAGSLVAELKEGLQAIDLLVVNAQQRAGLAMDALAALRVDPLTFVLPRLETALSRTGGWLGMRANGDGFGWTIAGLQLRAKRVANGARWQIGFAFARTLAGAAGGRLPIALQVDAGLDMGTAAISIRPTGQLALSLGEVVVAVDFSGAPKLSVQAPPWLDQPFTVLPVPAGNALRGKLNELLPRFLLSTAVSRLVEALLRASGAPTARVAALDALIADPVRFLSRSNALGSGGPGGSLDGTKVAALLSAIARALGQPGPTLALPGGLQVSASGAGVVTFALGTTAPIGGVLGLNAQLTIDEQKHAHPGGTVSLNIPAAGNFPGLAVAFGVNPTGQVTLAVTPGGGAAIQLLPTFSGFGALLSGAAQTLLPAVLDAIDDAVPGSALKNQSLSVASALDLYDAPGGFAAHSAQWRNLLSNGSIASIPGGARGAMLVAARSLLNSLIAGNPFDIEGSRLRWTSPSLAGVSGQLRVAAGWDGVGQGGGPSFSLAAVDWHINNTPLRLSFAAGFEGNALLVSAAVGADLSVISVSAVPTLSFSAGAGGVNLNLRPFGAANAAPLEVRLLPTPQVIATNALAGDLARVWLLPIAAKVIFEATRTIHASALWPSGPTLGQVLDSAHLRSGTNLVSVLPQLPALVTGALQGLLSGLSLPLGDLTIGVSGDAGKLGAKLKGKLPIEIGDFKLTLYLGERPSGPLGDADAGLTLNLFNLSGFAFQPQIKARGIGLGFANKNDRPLVDTDIVRFGEVAALAFFNVQLFGSFATSGWGFEASLARFGLPLGAATGGGGGGNPVAASLLSSDGGGSGGDTTGVSPECDIGVRFMAPSAFELTIGGQSGAFWLTVQKQLGPIYIEQIGVQTLENGKKIALLLDGGVRVSGLAVQVDDLTLIIPLAKLGDASQWGLDLKGMAVAMEAGTVKIAGGLLKNAGPPISYDGALMVDVAGRGFTAIGSYAKPTDALGEYTSFFVFVSLPIPLGGPPYFFVLGLGGGVGINRALIVPTDLNQIPSFPLVAAIDNSGFANDPMGALRQMGSNIPPRRGGFWLAAGLKFSTFVVVNTTAVVYVALDRGLEIGLLGLSRMALPAEDFAVAQIELAMKARFSTAEGLLSVQAQLTDRSYLFHPTCQLTGGFAFFLWFNTGKFVLTLGGYHKAFSKPAEFPVVPRLGFRWTVSDAVVIKGEAYFALTTTCVMAGGRLEASYHGGPVKAWFKCYLDVLVSWDPFFYVFDAGIEIGASVDTFLGEVSVSLGAAVHIEGPPLFGWVEVEIVVVTVRVEFGDPAREIDYIDDFDVFRDKYLTTGDGRDHPVDIHLRAGLLPTNPPGAEPAPGTKEAPWIVGAEWAFDSETRAPSNALRWDGLDRTLEATLDGAIDLAPMNRRKVTSRHVLAVRRANGSAVPGTLDPDRFVITQRGGNFPEATWRWQDPRAVQAGAANIRRLAGVRIDGIGEIVNRSALVKITGEVDDLPEYALPLPFDQPSSGFFADFRAIGTVANVMADLTVAWTLQERRVATSILLGAGEFAQARKAAGGRALSPLAQRDLMTRSAPARVVPLATGLSMEAPGQVPPPQFVSGADQAVRLDSPRLLSVLRHRVAPASAEPLALRTTVAKVPAAQRAPRMAAPRARTLVGARLQRVASAQRAAPTRALAGERSFLNPMFAPQSRAHSKAFDDLANRLMGQGVLLPAGTTHLWQLPETDQAGRARVRLRIDGLAAARVTWLDESGEVISDEEWPAHAARSVPMPEGAERLAVSCLGGAPVDRRTDVMRLPTMAGLSMSWSGADGVPAVGWQAGSQLAMVGAQTLLARGSSVQVSRPIGAGRFGQLSAGLVRAGDVMARQSAVETRLPIGVSVVLIQLDVVDLSAAADGDLAIACDGAMLSSKPVVVTAGTRRSLIYDAVPDADGRERGFFEVSVGSREAWRVAGVVGVAGTSGDWGERLAGGVPPELVSPHALTADGSVSVRFEIRSVGDPPQPKSTARAKGALHG